MKIDIFPKDPHDLYTTPLLQQTAYWSEVKSKLGFIPLAFEIEVREKDLHPALSSSSRIRDDILILYRKINKEELSEIQDYLEELNIEKGYIQELGEHEEEYVPDFNLSNV